LPHIDFSYSSWSRLGICPLPLFSMLVAFGMVRAPRERAKRGGKQTAGVNI
jgi:hypothetical protein